VVRKCSNVSKSRPDFHHLEPFSGCKRVETVNRGFSSGRIGSSFPCALEKLVVLAAEFQPCYGLVVTDGYTATTFTSKSAGKHIVAAAARWYPPPIRALGDALSLERRLYWFTWEWMQRNRHG